MWFKSHLGTTIPLRSIASRACFDPDFEELPPAGLLRRLMAMIYDGLLVLAIVLTTTGLANLFAPTGARPGRLQPPGRHANGHRPAPVERALY